MTDHPHDPADTRLTLAQALRRAAAELAAQAPPQGLQAQVMSAARAARMAGDKKPTVQRRWARWAAAAGAGVLGATTLLMPRLPPPARDLAAGAPGFMTLVPAEDWPKEATAAWLVSAELQGERLAALGLPYDPARAGERVRAELLLHPSGEVLAVRFIP